jgi:hypothetical protein
MISEELLTSSGSPSILSVEGIAYAQEPDNITRVGRKCFP